MKTQEEQLLITDEDTALVTQPVNLMSMIEYAVKNDKAIEVIKELRQMRDEDRKYNAKLAFDAAMEAVQNEVQTVVPDLTNTQTKRKYASFKALDEALRPIYKRHGLTISFNAAPSPNAEEIYVLCDVSHNHGHTKTYTLPMSTDATGPKGGGVMSKQQAAVAATSYGRSTLLKLMFNIPIGDPDVKLDDLDERIEFIRQFTDKNALQKYYKAAAAEAFNLNDFESMKALTKAKYEREAELERGA